MREKIRKIARALLAAIILLLSVPFLSAASADDIEKEIKLGEKVSKQIEEHWERVVDPVRVARLSMILGRQLPFTERDLPFEVRLIEEKRPNAFALPGGIIYFTTGMLDFCRSDDEIAAVMGHELTHADKRHVMIQVARNQRLSIGALAVLVATRGQGVAPILANLAQVAIMNSYSRDLEREADQGGLEFLNRSGYEPSAAVTVMERLLEEEIKRPYVDPGIYAGHPRTRERISELVKMMKTMGLPVRRKRSLHLLRTEITESDERMVLAIDGTPVWWGVSSEGTEELLKKANEAILVHLQMETSAFDVMIAGVAPERILKIGLGTVARESEIQEDMPAIEDFRENILDSLQKARAIHPVADYNR
ncbi:MAG TPA: M48 family metallopeptidase [Synergistales bacterium]|nr:M48 family metallopeptidase [Synergistales bacterium]HRV70657.1 M48 family metallopeptidase [Thermovirgaceae bacterium]